MTSKVFVSPDSLRLDSYRLAAAVVRSGFRPDYMIALWRGGASIGMYVHEFLKRMDIPTDHIAIRTSRYTGVDEASSTVTVHNLGYLTERLNSAAKVLIVDDVFDSGYSIAAVFESLHEKLGDNMPTDIRVATVYYKPKRNKTARVPEYYIHSTADWVVFPHEMEGLAIEEIEMSMGKDIANLVRTCQPEKK